MPNDPTKAYEEKLAKLIRSYSRKIMGVYNNAIIKVSLLTNLAKYQGSQFNLDTSPAIKARFDEIIKAMHDDANSLIVTSIKQSWELSNKKNDLISRRLIGDRDLTEKAKSLIYNPNEKALKEFIKRKDNGLNLSDRVWNSVEPYKHELEAGLADAVNSGKSAAETATTLKRYLKEPDKLFRRVRNKETGKLELSRAARNYHPGQGVYRSSFQNAIRLTGTETNIAFRSADHERWKTQDFTKGIEVKLSNNHPEYDICDALAGVYPKDYKFTGQHPRCRCYAVPILVSDEEFSQQEDELLGLSDNKPDIEYVQEIPAKAKEWIRKNAERINGYKSKPYWVNDNTKYIKELLKVKK